MKPVEPEPTRRSGRVQAKKIQSAINWRKDPPRQDEAEAQNSTEKQESSRVPPQMEANKVNQTKKAPAKRKRKPRQ